MPNTLTYLRHLRLVVTVTGFALAAAPLADAQGPQNQEGKTAEQVYKNKSA
jgi:hypothetical protein